MTENLPEKLHPNRANVDSIGTTDEVRLEDCDRDSREITENASGVSELQQVKNALAESEKRALIAVADLDNFRKRADRNARESVKYASLPMMNGLLESIDNLNRAIEAAENDADPMALLVGVKMVADQILEILKTSGCQPIAAIGQPFDPNLHEAVQMQASPDFPPNTVMAELRTGYMLHDRVIRPSQVIISTGTAQQ